MKRDAKTNAYDLTIKLNSRILPLPSPRTQPTTSPMGALSRFLYLPFFWPPFKKVLSHICVLLNSLAFILFALYKTCDF